MRSATISACRRPANRPSTQTKVAAPFPFLCLDSVRLLLPSRFRLPALLLHLILQTQKQLGLAAATSEALAIPQALELLSKALERLRRRRFLPPAEALAMLLALEAALTLELAAALQLRMILASVLRLAIPLTG